MPIFTLDISTTVYLGFALVGFVLLVTAVIFDVVTDAIGFELGGVAILPLLLGFIAMFGAGGLVARELLGIGSTASALVALATGSAGGLAARFALDALRRQESPTAFTLDSLIGSEGRVSIAVKATRDGSVYLTAAGATQEFAATADRDIPSGARVRVTAVAGTALVVTPINTLEVN